MKRRPRKGDRLVYAGPYAPGVTSRYGPGEVTGFRNERGVAWVTVRLIEESREAGEDRFADWPIAKVELAP